GEGGDEILAGYGRYRRAMRPWFLGGRSSHHRGTLDGFNILIDESKEWRQGLDNVERSLAKGYSNLQHSQALDCAEWLPNDLLIKLDRCLMAHGIEGRVPFLDLAFADFAFPLPDHLKVRHRKGKWLMRRWLENELKASQPHTRKRGFTVPIAEWLVGKGHQLGPLVASQSGIETLCKKEATQALFCTEGKREIQAQWVLLFYALWHQIHVEGRCAEGSAFDVLAA
ncbi:MAG: asparagine synthetase B, partial [Magnetovibrio sp.]|nr:asparagine synthetase B [Magnetovibrio sp.]